MQSFVSRSKTIECGEITKTDFNNKWSLAKYMLSGKFVHCYTLTGKWAPEAIEAAKEGLSSNLAIQSQDTVSCASEVVKNMGGSEEEQVMVAGFAGGLGLRGSGCGALAATMWKTILELVRKGEWKYTMSDPMAERIINKFYAETDYEIECHKICGQRFNSIDEHTEFIKNGGCDKLINVLAQLNKMEE